MSTKKIKKGPHPHNQKEQKQIAGCPRCRGRVVLSETSFATVPSGTITTSAESPEALAAASLTISPSGIEVPIRDTSGLAPLEVLPLSSVPLEAEPAKEPEAPPVVPEGFSPH